MPRRTRRRKSVLEHSNRTVKVLLMAGGIVVLQAVRPTIVSISSFGGREIVLHGKGLNICGVPAWERRQRRRRRSARCACSEGYDTRSADVKLSGVTLYDLLGISRQVGIAEIKTAYREKARRYHPDANPPSKRDECTKKFLQVQEAYEVLADPGLRADYDYSLRHPLSMHAFTSGFAHKGRNRNCGRNGSTGVDEDELANKQAWRTQWEAQVDGLRRGDLGRKKPGSWAAKMQQKRQEEAARNEAQQQGQKDAPQDVNNAQQ